MGRLKTMAILLLLAVLAGSAALTATQGMAVAQGQKKFAAFDPCAPGVLVLGQAWRELACPQPSDGNGEKIIRVKGYDGSLRLRYRGDTLQQQWQAELTENRRGLRVATPARNIPYILRSPTLPECDSPYVQYSSSVGIITFECVAKTAGRHQITLWVGERGVVKPYRYVAVVSEDDLPSRSEYEHSLLPDVETGQRVRIVGQGSSYPEFHFQVINRTDRRVTHVSVRAIFQDNGGFKVGDECGQYGATWRFNTSIEPNQTQWLAITREACLSRTTRFGADLLDATFSDGSKYRPER